MPDLTVRPQFLLGHADKTNVEIRSNSTASGPVKPLWHTVDLARCFFCFIFALALIGLTAPVGAQTSDPVSLKHLSLEQLMNIEVATVNAASKFNQKETAAPSYVTVITADEIQKYGYRTLADILESVPGFYVTNDRNHSYLGVRGFNRSDYNDRVLLLIDGHRLNDPVYNEALIGDEFPLDVDLIQRVEIIRGPGSALYGTNAFFAVINVITRPERDVDDAEIAADAESDGTPKVRATFGHQMAKGAELLLSGSYGWGKGSSHLFFPEFDSPATSNGITDFDQEKAYNFIASATYKDFTLQAVYGSRTKQIPTGSFGTVFDDPRNRTTDAAGYFDLKYQHQLGNGWQILARGAYDQSHYHGMYVYDDSQTGLPPYTLNHDLSSGERLSIAFDASRTLFEKHRVTLGTETQFNLKMNQSNYNESPYFLFLDDRRSSIVPALYIQDEFSVRKNLILSAGVRWDHYYSFGNTENPRLGLIYSPRERTTVKLLYGTAFRAPNNYELYYASPPDQVPSPSLKPETIRTTELVFEQYFATHAHFTIAGFYNDIRGLVAQQTNANGAVTFTNLQSAESKGIDCELAGKWPNGFQGRLSYTVQEDTDPRSKVDLSNSPTSLVKLDLSAPVFKRFVIGAIEGQYTSSVDSLQDNPIPGFLVVNATVSTSALLHLVSISASAYNLFNVRYANAVGPSFVEDSIQQNGRTLRIKFTYSFGNTQSR